MGQASAGGIGGVVGEIDRRARAVVLAVGVNRRLVEATAVLREAGQRQRWCALADHFPQTTYSGGPSTQAKGQIVFARVSRYRGDAARLRDGFKP